MSIFLSQNLTRIDGDTKLRILTGKQKADYVLASDSSGRVDWAPARGQYTGNRYIGELYGGGIVIDTWNRGDEETVLIAALQDVGSTDPMNFGTPGYVPPLSVRWSKQSTTFKGATSLYDGRRNHELARVGIDFSFLGNPGSVAINFDGYTGGINGYSDWYLPSAYEMRALYEAAFHINRQLGAEGFSIPGSTASYWTSTETDASNAISLDVNSGRLVNTVKTLACRMRPVRIEFTKVNRELVTNLDASDPLSYNDAKRPGRWVDTVSYGASSQYSFTTSATFSTEFGGHFKFRGTGGPVQNTGNLVDFYSNIGDTTTVTVEMWARLSPTASNFMMFGWNRYSVYFDASRRLGFSSGNGNPTPDLYGIPTSQVSALGLTSSWNHYVFEMRSDVSYSNNKMYVNGALQSLSQLGGVEVTKNFFSGFGRVAGWRDYANDLGSTFLGTLDIGVFRVYKRALSQAEVTRLFVQDQRRFEVGITSTHTLDNSPGTGTFSVVQNMLLNINGKRNGRLLRSDKDGNASWVDKTYLFDRPGGERFVGERFGGGIIASKWRYPSNVINYLVMADRDQNVFFATVYEGESVQTYFEVYLIDLRDYLTVGMPVSYGSPTNPKNLTVQSFTLRTGTFGTYWTRVFVNEVSSTVASNVPYLVTIGGSGMSVRWSSIASSNVAGAVSNFKGASNSLAIQQSGATNSVGRMAQLYQAEGFDGWYVPALSEFTSALSHLAAVGYNHGTFSMPSGKYWTSTQSPNNGSTRAMEVTVSSAGTVAGVTSSLKTTLNKVRPFRQLAVLQQKDPWPAGLSPWGDPVDNQVDPWDAKNWSQFTGIKTSTLEFHFNADKFNSLPGRTGTLASNPAVLDIAGGKPGQVRPFVTWDTSFSSVRFDGTYSTSDSTFTQNSFISFTTPIRTDLMGRVTFEAWVYPDLAVENISPDDYRCPIISTCGYTASQTTLGTLGQIPGGYMLSMGTNNGNDGYKLSLLFGDNAGQLLGNIKASITIGSVLSRSSWQHLVVTTQNGTPAIDKVYVNGVLLTDSAGTITTGTADAGSNALTSTHMRTLIGCSNYGLKKVFGGMIGQVRVYSSDMTAAEVKNNFESERARYGV